MSRARQGRPAPPRACSSSSSETADDGKIFMQFNQLKRRLACPIRSSATSPAASSHTNLVLKTRGRGTWARPLSICAPRLGGENGYESKDDKPADFDLEMAVSESSLGPQRGRRAGTLNLLGDVEWVLGTLSKSSASIGALFFRRDTLRVACPRLSYLPATEAHTLPRT